MKNNRLFKIIYYILEKGKVTAVELSEKFEVSVRTIYRDIDVISSAGIPIYVTSGRNGGIEIHKDYVLDKLFFTDQERKDILSALESVLVVSDISQKEVFEKLSALFNVHSDHWFEVDFSSWDNRDDRTTFNLLKEAVIQHKAVKIVYVNSYGEKTIRKIFPLKLVFKSKAWYVKAYCTFKEDFRFFKCTRIIELEMLSETFLSMEYPEKKDIHEPKYNRIKLRFKEDVAYRVYDEFHYQDILKLENGDLFVDVVMPEDNWLISYLLSFGNKVDVIEPVYLKKILADEGKKIYELYKT